MRVVSLDTPRAEILASMIGSDTDLAFIDYLDALPRYSAAFTVPDFFIESVQSWSGRIEVPLHAPNATLNAPSAAFEPRGAYVTEISAISDATREYSFLPRKAVNPLPLEPPAGSSTFSWSDQFARSRIDARGNIAIVTTLNENPFATLAITTPTVATCLSVIDPFADYQLSDKGHYSQLTSDRFGGTRALARDLADPEFRRLLDGFRGDTFKTRQAMIETVTSGATGKRALAAATAKVDSLLNRLVPRGVFRFGIAVRCEECRKKAFFAAGTFDARFVCPRCARSQQTPPIPVVGYELAEVVHEFVRHDGDVTVLAVDALRRRVGYGHVSAAFEHEYVTGKREKGELDLFTVIQGQLYIGECRSTGSLDEYDCSKLKRTARRLGAAGVVVAAMVECAGGCGDVCRDRRAMTGSSDTALGTGAGITGPRERLVALRQALAPGIPVVVMCKGELLGSVA